MSNGNLEIQVFGDINFVGLSSEKIEKVLSDLNDGLPSANVRIGNVECPILQENSPMPILKVGKHLYSDKSMICFLNRLNIAAVTLGNNHIGDYSVSGIKSTINTLQEASIEFTGAGMNINEAYRALHIVAHNISVSILSVCENEFGIATEEKAGAAGYNVRLLAKRIKEEKNVSDHVIIIIHGGNEFNPLPSPEATERYKFMIDFGASAVVGMHTHCPQGYEYYNGGLIIYSLGNFFFPNDEFKNSYSTWYEGYVAHLSISKNSITLQMIPYRYSSAEEKILLLKQNDIKIFTEYLNCLNEIIADNKMLRKYFVAWSIYKGERYAKELRWNQENVSSDEKIQKSLQIQNLFRCEAHQELMKTYFETKSAMEETHCKKYWEDLKKLFFIPLSMDKWQEELECFYDEIYLENKEEVLKFVQGGGNIYICGAGKCGVAIYSFLMQKKQIVTSFLDNNSQKEGEYICNVCIETYDIIKRIYNKKDKYLVAMINKQAQKTVVQQLKNLGVLDSQIIICRNEERYANNKIK